MKTLTQLTELDLIEQLHDMRDVDADDDNTRNLEYWVGMAEFNEYR